MDLPSKTMYDTFKDELWKELGPLDPNWFEILTLQTSADEENVSDQDDLCANQEGNSTTLSNKAAIDSQLFSTPKVFRHRRIVSPQTEDEQSFTVEQEKETVPWTATQSPHLFGMSKQGAPEEKYGGILPPSQNSFDLLHTPHKSPVSYAKQISESLGAQINPDISWTSSLNTPPPVPSTLILSKTDESPRPPSISAEKNVVFVRKLFPSLSNAPAVASLKNNDMPAVHQGVVSPEAESHDSLQPSVNQNDAVWQQKLPDAIEDGEIHSTVSSILDGAENVLSIFFANSNSALRKVKPDRIRRKQIVQTKQSADISTTNTASSKVETGDQNPGRFPSSPPVKPADTGMSQWSPLSLSEIPPCSSNNISTKQLQSDSDPGQLVRPPMKTAAFIKKQRKFVYTVGTLKPQIQGKEPQSQNTDASPGIPDSGHEVGAKHSRKALAGADYCSTGSDALPKQGNPNEESLLPSEQAKAQDLDMSQLCREFAQDFNHISDCGNLSKVTDDTQNPFSPSACLSAMKQAKQKARQANLHHNCDGISNRKLISTTNQNYSISEGTTSDSGFQSAVADVTHMTASSFALPSSENSVQSQHWPGFKSDIHNMANFSSTNKENEKVDLDAETEVKLSSGLKAHLKERLTLDPERESELHIESTSAQLLNSVRGTVDNTNCIPLNGRVRGSLPEKTAVSLPSLRASGFKTASNKGIQISSANLDRAKLLFEETETEKTFSHQPIKCDNAIKHKIDESHGSVKDTTSNSNQTPSFERLGDPKCQLTASQKADVTELCTLLEEAESQFEFTQFKNAKLKHCQDDATCLPKADKDLDPDFLTGIDFDDSFSSDAEKCLATTGMPDEVTSVSYDKTNCGTSDTTSKSTCMSKALNKENSIIGDIPSSSVHISEGSNCLMSAEQKNLHGVENTETNQLENKNPLMLGMAFKTAGGNVLRVSKACLSKAATLFADLEKTLTDHKSPDKQNRETDAKTKQKCSMNSNTGKEGLNYNLKDKDKNHVEERVQGCFPYMTESVSLDQQVVSVRDKDATKSFKSSNVVTATCQSGFNMASGKAISISAKYMQQADAFFKDCDLMDHVNTTSVKQKKSIEAVSESIDNKQNFSKYKKPQMAKVNISEEHVSGCTMSETVNAGLLLHHRNKTHSDKEMNSISYVIPASQNAVSFHGNLCSTSKPLPSPLCTSSKNIDSSATDGLSSGDGLCTASGRNGNVLGDSMKRAECLLNEDHTPEDTKKHPSSQKEIPPTTGQPSASAQFAIPKTGGFQTASGKGIAISSAALKKAKLLLNEAEDETSVQSQSKMPAHGPPPRSGRFVVSSGKPVALSSEALQKTKALFSDISLSVDVLDTNSTDKKQRNGDNTEKIHCGFTTATGEKVHVSQKNLLTAKHLFKEFEDSDSTKVMDMADSFVKNEEMDGSNGIPVKNTKKRAQMSGSGSEKKNLSNLQQSQILMVNIPEEPGKGCIEDTNLKMKQKEDTLPPQNSGFQTASGKQVSILSEALQKVKTLLTECEGAEDKIYAGPPYSKVPIPGPPSMNSAFLAASGKQVSVSSEALQKAKALFSDISLNTDIPAASDTKNSDKKHEDAQTHGEKIHCGFTSAGGAKVHVSQKNLLKAKHLLKDFDDSVFTKGLQDAHGFIKDYEMDGNTRMPVKPKKNERVSTNIPEQNGNGCIEDPNQQVKQKEDTLPLHNGGFHTASGKGVTVSSEALKKAKTLLSECEVDDDDKIDAMLPHSKVPPFRTSGFLAASGKQVSVSSEALQKAKALFSDISLNTDIPAASDTRKSDKKHEDAQTHGEKIHCGFTSAGGAKVHVSQKNLLKAKHLLKDFDDSVSTKVMQDAQGFIKDYEIDGNNRMPVKPKKNDASLNGSGSGKKSLSKLKPDQRVMITISEEPRSGCIEDANKQAKQKEDTLPLQNCGFLTASGKGVTISSEALKKAKTLLSEYEPVDDEIDVARPNSKVSAPVPPFRNSGFHAASGKRMPVSSEAFQKAKAFFGDISTDITAVSNTKKSEKKHEDTQTNGEKIHCFLTTAGGAKVHVSEKSLVKANCLFKEIADGESNDSHLYSKSLQDIHELDVKGTLNSNLSTASDKDMPTNENAASVAKSIASLQNTDASESRESSSVHGHSFIKERAPTDAFKFQEDKITPARVGSLHDRVGQEMPHVLDNEVNQPSSSNESKLVRAEESALLNFQSLYLTGCTDTQQKFLAQEALDCTKALLEDECVAGQSLSLTLKSVPLQDSPKSSSRSAQEDKGKGKRSTEDEDIAGQPPLKRRLLEEFDRTSDDPKGSALHPVRSCPNGIIKDRRVFKYSVSLHPNITRPCRNGKNYMETRSQNPTLPQPSTSEDSRSAQSRMPAFVPPFIKNAKTGSFKNSVLKDNTRTPSAFVPPFKKQRTVVQESFSKPQEEEDKHHQIFVKPSNSSTYKPPAKKTEGNTDVTAPVDTTGDAVLNHQSLPVGCGSASPEAEASGVDDTFSTNQDLHNIELARDMQDMRIRKKKRQTIRPLPGSLFLTKTSGVARIPLKVAVNGKPPAKYSPKQLYEYGVQKHVSEITSETAESFRFSLLQFIKREAFADGGGVQLGDGGWLIPSNDGTAGKEEFYRALCDTPGVDPKLISEPWVYNHYRWIVWKQASMEKSFPETMGSLCFTPEQVLLQLKYRYDVEMDHSRRPALRKITEKDDTAAKTLVLCVCEIVSRGHSPVKQIDSETPQGADAKVQPAVVCLTDGWYAIKTQLDEPLTVMLHKGLLAAGGKLIIHGAQLVGSQDACPPLEAPESLMLKICANSSRPARWDVKLGFYKDPRPFLLPLSSLYSNGGPVGCVDVIILRSYPIQWMERKQDGSVVFRSVRAEEKEARRYDSHKQKSMEVLFAKIQAEFEQEEKVNVKPQRRRQTMSRQDIASLQDGEELYEAVGDDPAYLEVHLSEQQLEALHTYRRTLMEKKQAEMQDRYRRSLEAEDNEKSCPKRDVTPVWRLCIADSLDQACTVYQLNLWRPSSDLQSLLKEGCRYKVYNLSTSEGKKRSGIESVQLTGTKKTQFQDLQTSQEFLSARFQPRVATNFVTLQNPEFQPLCGEVDLTGYVISIIDGQGSSPALYLADGKLNFVKVRCFSSLSHSGLEDVVKLHMFLALSNLQLRGQSMYPTPVVYAGDLTVFSTNPKEVHLQESLSELKHLVQCQENFSLTAEERLSHLLKSDGLSSISSPALQPQTSGSVTNRRQDTKTRVISQKPIKSLGSFTPVSRNPSATTSSTEKDPRSLKRKRALDYLSRVPSPPPLAHLSPMASPCVNKTFNPPRRSGTPSTLKTVQTSAPKPTVSLEEDEWVNDEELALIDTQSLHVE